MSDFSGHAPDIDKFLVRQRFASCCFSAQSAERAELFSRAVGFTHRLRLMIQVKNIYRLPIGLRQVLSEILNDQFRCQSSGGGRLKNSGTGLD